MKAAVCPSCGAPVQFRWSGAVQTTCEFCRSILVRHDVDLTRVGQVGDIPEDPSPIQMGCEGVFREKAFQVVGRIVYSYEQGVWNEWHILFQDGSSGWLSDAQLEYVVSSLFSSDNVQNPAELERGWYAVWLERKNIVTSITRAHYVGVEGELPFEYWDKAEVVFADLRSHDGRFATIDGTEQPPLLFLGEFVELDELKLGNLRQFEGWS
jgi:hypothetical protein